MVGSEAEEKIMRTVNSVTRLKLSFRAVGLGSIPNLSLSVRALARAGHTVISWPIAKSDDKIT